MSTLLVDTTARTREPAKGDVDMYNHVLPAIEEYIERLNLRCRYSTENNTWSVENDHGQLVTLAPGFSLTLGYDLSWDATVETIEAHVIPCLMRRRLRRKSLLLETFTFEIETPEFHPVRTGASGTLSLTKKEEKK